MKTNWMKYIFFSIVIALIGLAIYIIYQDNQVKKIPVEVEKTEIATDPQINIGITEYDTINPILSKSKDVQYISKLVYRSLINITPDFKAENDIIEEWSKINETTYIIRIKKGIKWHNGTLVTSKDIKFTIDGIKDLKGESIYKKNVENILNVEIIDEYTIKIYLNTEIPFFEYMLSFPILSADSYNPQTLESKTNLPIGTGDYKISSINEKEILLEKRSIALDFKVEKISIKTYNLPIDLYNNITRENIDIISTTNIDYEQYIGTIGFNDFLSPNREFDYLAININNKILSNKEVRQVLSYAIDKKAIIYNVYKNKYFISDFPLDYGSYLYNNEELKKEYNEDKAKRTLLDNGWKYEDGVWKKPGVTNRLEFNLIINENQVNRLLVGENIKEQLERIGIRINIQRVSNNRYENYLKNKNYELILTGSITSICPDVNSYLGVNNLFNYYNEEVIDLLKEVNSIKDTNFLKEKYNRIIEIYNEDVPFVSLYFNSNILICNDKIKGNLEHNWYNLFYNTPLWYKVKNQ